MGLDRLAIGKLVSERKCKSRPRRYLCPLNSQNVAPITDRG